MPDDGKGSSMLLLLLMMMMGRWDAHQISLLYSWITIVSQSVLWLDWKSEEWTLYRGRGGKYEKCVSAVEEVEEVCVV